MDGGHDGNSVLDGAVGKSDLAAAKLGVNVIVVAAAMKVNRHAVASGAPLLVDNTS